MLQFQCNDIAKPIELFAIFKLLQIDLFNTLQHWTAHILYEKEKRKHLNGKKRAFPTWLPQKPLHPNAIYVTII